MKLAHLIWAGIWRSPARSVFTLLSITVAFVLFGLLQGLNAGFDRAIKDARLDGLATNPRVPGGPPMPISAMAQIERMPGVTLVTHRAVFFGQWKEPKNTVLLLATDAPKWFKMRSGFAIADEVRAAYMRNRMGMIVTPAMQKHYGWQIGQRIPFTSQLLHRDGSPNWEFELVGLFDSVQHPNQTPLAMVHYDYVDAERATDRGTAEQFMIRIADPNRSTQTALAIDKLFANSPSETRTRSDKERAQGTLKQIGDVRFITNSIVAAVFFTLLFLTGNTMRQSIRERIPEFAVLKTLGFSDGIVFAVVFAEAGAVVCAGCGRGACDLGIRGSLRNRPHRPDSGFVAGSRSRASLPPSVSRSSAPRCRRGACASFASLTRWRVDERIPANARRRRR